MADKDNKEKISKKEKITLKPARRFFARAFDLFIVATLCLPIYYFLGIKEFTFTNYLIVQGIYTGVFFLYDFLMSLICNATVGKLLLRIGISKDNDKRLGFAGALVRTSILLVTGLGLLIPPVTLVTGIISILLIRKKKKLLWERGNKVYAHHLTGIRICWSVLFVIALALVFQIPIAVDYFTLVPNTGNITTQQFEENYEVLSVKYLQSIENGGRKIDRTYYDDNKLFNMEGFSYLTDENGTVTGFTYKTLVKYDDTYTAQERDIIAIGLITMITADKHNRATYNMILSSFSKVFDEPFVNHELIGGDIRVKHQTRMTTEGYSITYTVTRESSGT